jgi:hypothetical protein
VDTLVLSQPPFKSFLRPIKYGCKLLAEPNYLLCPTRLKVGVGSPCGCPPPDVEGKLILRSSSLMTPPMLGNCIPEASSVGLRSPRTSLLTYLFSSTSTYGVKDIFHFWYVVLCSGEPSFQVNLLETSRARPHCSLVCGALVWASFSLSPFESSLLSLTSL